MKTADESGKTCAELARTVFSLLDVISWIVSSSQESQCVVSVTILNASGRNAAIDCLRFCVLRTSYRRFLMPLSRSGSCASALSYWLLFPAVRAVIFSFCFSADNYFRTGSSLFRHILAYPADTSVENGQMSKDFTKLPHIENMCALLLDTDKAGADVRQR